MINTEMILELINKQLTEVMLKDEEFYSNYNFILSNEQQFVKDKERKKGTIYLVVKFMPASIDFGQTILPITLNAVAERNKIEVCQQLLLEYAQTYNLTTSEDETIKQVYTSPSMLSNFNEVYDGFRSLLYMSGNFLISSNSNNCKVYVSGEDEELPCISFSSTFDIQLDSQPFYSTGNFTQSVGKVGTYAINISTYLIDSKFLNRVLNIVYKNTEQEPEGINTSFYFDIVFKNGLGLKNIKFKLANFTFNQNIGELPLATLTFTN